MARGELLWAPSPEACERAAITHYMRWLAESRGLAFDTYAELWEWSVADLEAFWSSVWEFGEVRASEPYQRVLARRGMPGAEWFPGARLNYAEHALARARGSEPAIVHRSELGGDGELTWDELATQVAAAAAGLRALGVAAGDRVAAYLPNVPETVIAFLACASIGAVWSSCSPDFGLRSVVDRFSQLEPAVLLAVDGYRYGGRDFDRRATIAELQAALPTLQATVVLPYLDPGADLGGVARGRSWSELLADGAGAPLRFDPVHFDHPLWVLYSSGTTGPPKAIVHGHGGILLEQLKKGLLHLDAGPRDRMFWFTTTGWMMWNFTVGCLLTGATIVLYDGSPAHPDMHALWEFAAASGMTCFGTSASYIAACLKAGVVPAEAHDLSRLRSVGSTGSPLSPEGFRWVYERVKPDAWLFSTSGGTDVCTAFVGGCPLLPVHAGELQCRALGAAVHAFDEAGRSVIDQVGELVITEPMPSMPLHLLNDPGGARYRATYFDVYPGVWRHGDWIEVTARGTAMITGRSDATINRHGVRMGTSELYRAVLALEELVDALAVDIPRAGAEGRLLLFVVLADGVVLDDALRAQVRERIRDDCSPRHVPDEVVAVGEVPRTLSGKLLEVPVKRILMGVGVEEAASRDSLANPDSLDVFARLAEELTGARPRAREPR